MQLGMILNAANPSCKVLPPLRERSSQPFHYMTMRLVFQAHQGLLVSQVQTKRPITKGEMLGAQSKSMISMARMWEANSKARDSLLASVVKVNEQKDLQFKIANLEKARDLGVIT